MREVREKQKKEPENVPEGKLGREKSAASAPMAGAVRGAERTILRCPVSRALLRRVAVQQRAVMVRTITESPTLEKASESIQSNRPPTIYISSLNNVTQYNI